MIHELHLNAEQQNALLNEACDPELLDWATGHLEACDACRKSLESKAAQPSWWSRAEEFQFNSHCSTVSPDGLRRGHDLGEFGPSDALGGNAAMLRDLASIVGPPKHPELLGQLGNYEIERVIGRGGMGIVLRGFDRELHRPVAIKVISPHLAHSGTARKRFEREARAAAAVVHPNVMPIHSVNTSKGHPFLVMPLLSGRSLQAQVDQFGPMDTKDVVRVGIQIAAGLAAAHQQGLIHRDIKPANILIEQDVSRVVITDFGLARAADDLAMTQTGWLAGTPHYMSPEQASGAAIDQRSDLFSLGSVLYFLATGREPFRAEKPMAVLHKICNEPAIPPNQINSDVPATLSDIVEKLLEKQPNDRFPAAARVQRILEEYLTELQHPKGRRHAVRVVTRRVRLRRQRWLLAGIALALAPLGFALGKFLLPVIWNKPAAAVTGGNAGVVADSQSDRETNVQPPAAPAIEFDIAAPAIAAWAAYDLETEMQGLRAQLQWLETSLGQDPTAVVAPQRSYWQRWFPQPSLPLEPFELKFGDPPLDAVESAIEPPRGSIPRRN